MDITSTQCPGMIGFFLGYTAFGIWSLLRKGEGGVGYEYNNICRLFCRRFGFEARYSRLEYIYTNTYFLSRTFLFRRRVTAVSMSGKGFKEMLSTPSLCYPSYQTKSRLSQSSRRDPSTIPTIQFYPPAHIHTSKSQHPPSNLLFPSPNPH